MRDVNQKFWEWVENEKSKKGDLTMKDYPNKTKFEQMITGWGYDAPRKIVENGTPKYWCWDTDNKDEKKGMSTYYYPVKVS